MIRHCYFFHTLLVAIKSELEPETSTFVNIVTLVNYYIMFNNESGLNVFDVTLLGFISGLTAQSHSFDEEIWSSVQHVTEARPVLQFTKRRLFFPLVTVCYNSTCVISDRLNMSNENYAL